MSSNWEEFYAKNPPPSDLIKSESLLNDFIRRHHDRQIALVTVSYSKDIFYFTYLIIFLINFHIYRVVVQQYL